MSAEKSISKEKGNNEKDPKFHSKHIKHDPNGESARAVFGLKGENGEVKGS